MGLKRGDQARGASSRHSQPFLAGGGAYLAQHSARPALHPSAVIADLFSLNKHPEWMATCHFVGRGARSFHPFRRGAVARASAELLVAQAGVLGAAREHSTQVAIRVCSPGAAAQAQAFLVLEVARDELPGLGRREHPRGTHLVAVGRAVIRPMFAIGALARAPVLDVVAGKADDVEYT